MLFQKLLPILLLAFGTLFSLIDESIEYENTDNADDNVPNLDLRGAANNEQRTFLRFLTQQGGGNPPRRRMARSFRETGTVHQCDIFPGRNTAACGECTSYVPIGRPHIECMQCIVCAKGWRKLNRRSAADDDDDDTQCSYSAGGKYTCEKCKLVDADVEINSGEVDLTICKKCSKCTG